MVNELPDWILPEEVPESVMGFSVDYRFMIRWKAGLMWRMRELDEYEYAWSLDTDSFIQGPITYDVFGVMAAASFMSPTMASGSARATCG